MLILACALVLIAGYAAFGGDSEDGAQVQPAGTSTSTSITSTVARSSSTTTPVTSTTAVTAPSEQVPPLGARYAVPPTEAEPTAKQLAVDIAYELTTYEATDDHTARLAALGSSDVTLLAEASEPLTYTGSWSRGEVIYPQLGGLTEDRASVMVVTRQTVGTTDGTESSVVRTLDIRLILGETGWVFDSLSSAGGTFDDLEDLTVAHAIAGDPRIEMPDSARADILSGLVSPTLLSVMADLADQTPYGVVVLATGHPHNVFETDRQSHHTVGQAVDIYRLGDDPVISDREPDSATRAITEWIYDHPDVLQVGSPWDLDGAQSRRSFTDAVHQDHIHLAVDG